jgi:hypothetical protein
MPFWSERSLLHLPVSLAPDRRSVVTRFMALFWRWRHRLLPVQPSARPPAREAISHASLPHIQVEATPQDSAFVRTFVSVCVVVWAALLVLALAVDPLGGYGTGLLQPLVPNDRDIKAVAYERASPRPEAIVVGSSRVMMFPPACLTSTLNLPAFNLGFNSARVEDYVAAFRFAQSLGPVKRILLGVDPEAFHNVVSPDDRLLQSRHLASFIEPRLKPSRWEGAFQWVTAPLTFETLSASLRSLSFAVAGGRPPAAYTFDAAGMIHEPVRDRLIEAGRFNLAPFLSTSVTEYEARYAGFSSLSESRTAEFTAFLGEVAKAGVELDAFIPPLHPTAVRDLAHTTLASRTADTEALLTDLAGRGLLRFVALPTLSSFGGDPELFVDGAHMMPANSVRIIAAVYRSSPCAV